MKKTIFLLSLIGLLFLIPVVSAETSPQVSLLTEIRDILNSILNTLQNSIATKLQMIVDKNTTVNVNVEPNITVNPTPVIIEPNITVEPQINVVGANDMPKRGNIVLREPFYVSPSLTEEIRISASIYTSLPNGECNITLSTNCNGCQVRAAKNITAIGSGFDCERGDCSGTISINNEFSMIRIKPSAGASYNHMYLAYNCV